MNSNIEAIAANFDSVEQKVNMLFGITMAVSYILEHMDGLPIAKKDHIRSKITSLSTPSDKNGNPKREALRTLDLILKGSETSPSADPFLN